MDIKTLIHNKDYKGLELALTAHPELANEGIPADEGNTAKAHPLHRICDGVYANRYADEEAVQMAKIFLAHGANVNGNVRTWKQDTPLIAAASLHADKVGILCIENGADIHHAGSHGGTALHWAAWCGRPVLAERLIQAGAEVNRRCTDFQSTPLFWAVRGRKFGGYPDTSGHLACVNLLLLAGADKYIPNLDGTTVFDLTAEDDRALRDLLESEVPG
jgi:ankyrin repeat protein